MFYIYYIQIMHVYYMVINASLGIYIYISKDRNTHAYNVITSFGSFLSGKAVERKKSLHKVPPTINSDLVEREVANPQIPNSHSRDSNPVIGLG